MDSAGADLGLMPTYFPALFIISSGIIGISFATWLWYRVAQIPVRGHTVGECFPPRGLSLVSAFIPSVFVIPTPSSSYS